MTNFHPPPQMLKDYRVQSKSSRENSSNSAIHKAVGSLVTSHSLQNGKKNPLVGITLRHCSPIHGFRDFQEIYQSNHETAGNREAGGVVKIVL